MLEAFLCYEFLPLYVDIFKYLLGTRFKRHEIAFLVDVPDPHICGRFLFYLPVYYELFAMKNYHSLPGLLVEAKTGFLPDFLAARAIRGWNTLRSGIL